MLGERTHSGLNDFMKAENRDICATGYGNGGKKPRWHCSAQWTLQWEHRV